MLLRSSALERILKGLKDEAKITGSAVVSRDGLLIASDIPNGVHEETFAIMAATMLGAGVTANSELKRSIPDRIIVESSDGKIIVTGVGPNMLLVVVVPDNANNSTIIPAIDNAISKIKTV
ncbi:MAG: roadblock/LC7 domain-containing protein [Thermoplasmata archaeon]